MFDINGERTTAETVNATEGLRQLARREAAISYEDAASTLGEVVMVREIADPIDYPRHLPAFDYIDN